MAMVIRFIADNNLRLVLLFLLLIFWLIDYKTKSSFSFCLFHLVTGKRCYACGTLRGVSAFLHCDFIYAFQLNPLNIVSIPALAYIFTFVWRKNRL